MLVSTLLAVSSFTFLLSFKEGTVHDPGQKLFPLLLLVRIARNEQEDAAAWDDAPHQEHQEYEDPEDEESSWDEIDGYADPHPQRRIDPPLA